LAARNFFSSASVAMPDIVSWSCSLPLSLPPCVLSQPFMESISGPCAAAIRSASRFTPVDSARFGASSVISSACL
jgi:hypothetical protein